MKKIILTLTGIVIGISLFSCGDTKDSPASIASKWCDLNGKAHKATDGPEKEAANLSLKQFENEMEARYKDDQTFMKQIETEVEKCEDASERK